MSDCGKVCRNRDSTRYTRRLLPHLYCTLKAYSTVCFTELQLLWYLQSVLSSFRIHVHSSLSVMIFFPTKETSCWVWQPPVACCLWFPLRCASPARCCVYFLVSPHLQFPLKSKFELSIRKATCVWHLNWKRSLKYCTYLKFKCVWIYACWPLGIVQCSI